MFRRGFTNMDFDALNFAAMNFAQMFPQPEVRLNYINSMIHNFNSMLGPFQAAWVMSQFSQLRDLDEKFAFIWKLPEAHQCLTPAMEMMIESMKRENESERLKTEGNIYYRQNKLSEALNFYNLAIFFAPHPEISNEEERRNVSLNPNDMTKYRTLALSYANRAAVLLEMKKYDECLRDIELALKSGYPELLKSKLLERKEKCLSGQRQESSSAVRVEEELPVLSEPNSTIPSLSSAVKFDYSKKKGRHVVAVKDIHPGDVIAVEESPFTCMHLDHINKRCLVCSRISSAPLPCPSCMMVFCSEACRTVGLKDLHLKECKAFAVLFELFLNMNSYAIIALKLLFRTPFAELKEKFNAIQKEAKELSPEKLGFDSKGIYSSTDYRTVFHLPSRPERNREQDTFKMCLVAVILTKFVCMAEGISFSTDNLPANTFQDIVTKGTIILHLLVNQPIQMLLQTAKVDASIVGELSQIMGAGIFPAVALMNHSCNASAYSYNIGPVMIVRAMRLIPVGNEVTISYGPTFEKLPKILRKQRFQELRINCSCEACVKDWPLNDKLPYAEFKCIRCSEPLDETKCDRCDIDYLKPDYEGEKKAAVEQWRIRIYHFKQAEERFHHAAQKLKTKQPVTKADFDDVCKFALMLESNVKFPSQIFFQVKAVMFGYVREV